MTNKKPVTKLTLVSAVVALMLCVAMLMGTTYAWFTDSVTSAGNIIKTGKLNIDLLVMGGNTGFTEYTSIKNASSKIFDYQQWEPGYTLWTNAKVTTTGNLALKYTLRFIGEGLATAKLAEAIDVYYASAQIEKPAADPRPDLDNIQGLTKLGTLKTVFEQGAGVVMNGEMIPGAANNGITGEQFATIVLQMQKEAGNEYQNIQIPTFDLQLVAGQLESESDSFDNHYDQGAVYPVLDSASFQAALTTAQEGDTILLGSGSVIDIPATTAIPGGVSIQGSGANQSTLRIVTATGDGLKITKDNVSISGVTVDGSAITSNGYNSLVNVEADGAVISDCVFTGGGHSTWNSSILVESTAGTCTVKNCKISGSFRGILRESCNPTIIIENCDIDAVYPFNIDGGNGGEVIVNNSKLHGWTSYSGIEKVTFTNCEFSGANSGYDVIAAYVDTYLINCTFDNSFDLYAQKFGLTWTVNNCTKNGTPVTADNFKTLFKDSDVWNRCTCVVNDVTVPADN